MIVAAYTIVNCVGSSRSLCWISAISTKPF
uniref:Uncharacterized protein n=1 Tax=Arundo donax TaxID=35708 RepID=A0A0A9AP58_ARUDO